MNIIKQFIGGYLDTFLTSDSQKEGEEKLNLREITWFYLAIYMINQFETKCPSACLRWVGWVMQTFISWCVWWVILRS